MKKKIIYLALSTLFVFITTISSVYAWYINSFDLETDDSVKLSANNSYFGGGDGTKDNPYLIKTSKHLYNLAWLQDLGYFDSKVYYFELKNNIDMSLLKKDGVESPIPTIGIDTHPFKGNFNGNGYKIDNLLISTSFPESNKKVIKPSKAILDKHTTDTINNGEIITNYNGMFGLTTTEDGSSISNFVISNTSIVSSKNILVGFICGYVNISLENVLVASSNMSISKDVSYISSYTVLSKYGIIGDKAETISWGEDNTNTWGGTIDFYDIQKRLTYMINGNYKTQTMGSTSVRNYGDELITQYFEGSFEKPSYSCIEYTSLIPINITNDIESSYYTQNTSEQINENTNNGYIVGTNSKSTNFTVQTRKINYNDYNVSNSFNSKNLYEAYTNTNQSSNLSLLTIKPTKDNSSNIYQINDEYNTSTNLIDSSLSRDTYKNLGLNKYSSIRENLNNIYSSSAIKDNTMLNYYLRWGSNFDINSETAISNWPTFTGKAIINGVSYDSYEFLRASINFTSKERGVFASIFTPWGDSATNFVMNGLIDVTRDSSGKVEKKLRIDKVYTDNNGLIKYVYSDNSTKVESGYNENNETLAYSFSNWNVKMSKNLFALYYCEIPLMVGDYAFGRCDLSSGYAGCTYNYIDIGANSSETTSSTKIKNIDYTYINLANVSGYASITDDSYTLSNARFVVYASETSDLYFSVFRSILNGNLVYYAFNGNNTIESSNASKKDSFDDLHD